ncbi:MAG TPA: hypothetical protein VFN05_14075, partial [Actinomycetes bacterium]|nr:hypothetical protein [Actinomycetes bacterium]
MGKPPELWTPEEAQAAKRAFLKRRPTVTAEQALELWQYWRWSDPDELLFDDPEDSLALLVHARAHGATVPGTEDDGVVGQLQRTHGKLLAPLVPDGPTWGPSAALSPAMRAALDAPIMEAWVYTDGRDPDLILIIGKGVPEIRHRVLPDALITSLRVRCVADDFVNDGIIRIEMPGPHPAALPVPPLPLLGQYVGVLPPTAARAARSAMADLIGRLRQLENETGLIRVLETHRSAHDDLFSSITTLAEAAQDGPVLCAPDATGQGPGTVAVVPYRQVPSDAGGVLQLELSTDLLRSRAYDELERLHQRATIDRIMSDISLRREYYQKQAENFRGLAEEYLSVDEEERGLLFGDTVRVTLEWDAALGLPRRLTRPEEIRAETYYTEVVPGLEQTYRDWQARMEAMATGIAEATRRGDAPLPRLLASRFFDAALRDGEGHDDPEVQAAFEAWREDVQPMVVLEWRRILRRLDLAERDVFTRQTFFHTWRTASSLIMAPFAVLDRSRTAVLLDPERRVMVVRDPVHRAVPAGRDEDAEALWGQLDAMVQARPPSAERESPRATGPEFIAALLDALRRSPCEILRRILEELSDPSRQAPASELTDLEGR